MTPDELKKRSFSIALRGYARGEVDAYIASLLDRYAELYRSYEALEQKQAETEAELADMQKNADAIRRALIHSQNAAAKVVDNARQKGEALEALTRKRCGQVIAEFRDQIRSERETLNTLRDQVVDFKRRVYAQYQEHIHQLEDLTASLGDGWDMTPTEATRTVLSLLRGEVDRRTRNEEIEEEKLDREIDAVLDRIAKKTEEGAENGER